MARKVVLPVSLEPEMRPWLDRAAARRHTSRAAIVREAIAAYARLHPMLGDVDGSESGDDESAVLLVTA